MPTNAILLPPYVDLRDRYTVTNNLRGNFHALVQNITNLNDPCLPTWEEKINAAVMHQGLLVKALRQSARQLFPEQVTVHADVPWNSTEVYEEVSRIFAPMFAAVAQPSLSGYITRVIKAHHWWSRVMNNLAPNVALRNKSLGEMLIHNRMQGAAINHPIGSASLNTGTRNSLGTRISFLGQISANDITWKTSDGRIGYGDGITGHDSSQMMMFGVERFMGYDCVMISANGILMRFRYECDDVCDPRAHWELTLVGYGLNDDDQIAQLESIWDGENFERTILRMTSSWCTINGGAMPMFSENTSMCSWTGYGSLRWPKSEVERKAGMHYGMFTSMFYRNRTAFRQAVNMYCATLHRSWRTELHNSMRACGCGHLIVSHCTPAARRARARVWNWDSIPTAVRIIMEFDLQLGLDEPNESEGGS